MLSCWIQLALLILLRISISQANEGETLLMIKTCFKNGNTVLSDWKDPSSYCSWNGVNCLHGTSKVVLLNLTQLDLGGKISPAIGKLESLVHIDLSANNLYGHIPSSVSQLMRLRHFDLSANNLYGRIPSSVSQLTRLRHLSLNNNRLSGPIPTALLRMPNLVTLYLGQNKFCGEIPPQLYRNQVLTVLGLDDNNLEGTLPPDMCVFTKFIYLGLKNNNMTGNIPPKIGNCTTMQFLDLSLNQLTGEIPSSIGFLHVSTLSLNDNKLSGPIPSSIGLMNNLKFLNLSNNLLTGPIPSILGNMQNITKLLLQENKLTGTIPPELGNMSSLRTLELTGNQLTGTIPPELGKLRTLTHLKLANNDLYGSLPENLSSCVSLNGIDAHGNNLNGTIPRAFVELRTMAYLILSSNKLSGPIPVELGNIVNLDTIDLSSNEFSGSIPSSIGVLQHLLRLNLSNNHLSGLIPMEFGHLTGIMEIDISFNNLSGQIPLELGLLQSLILLQAENNKLSGDLLPLTNCFSLSILNVSYNNFVGFVPVIKNFSRFSAGSFMGNPGLCGYWNSSFRHHSPSLSRHRASLPKASILGIISFGSVIIVLLILVTAYLAFRRCKVHKSDTPPKLVILNANLACLVYDDIMRMSNDLSESHIAGRGASSVVYKCYIPSRKPIAIKKISSKPHNLDLFKTELEIVSNINHQNLVSLHGYSMSPSGYLLIYEYMEKGSLSDLLHGSTSMEKLDWDGRLRIAVGAARGLEYLHHGCNPKIIHRDVKSSNILVDNDGEAHIADFGLAKSVLISQTHTSTFVMGTIGYIDPEYAETTRLTQKSDVYSFGIVLLELLTGRKAFDKGCNLHQLIQEKTANNMTTVMDIVDPTISFTCKDIEVKEMFRLALLCTKLKSADRPNMREVSHVLECLIRPSHRQRPNFDASATTSNNSFINL